MVLVFAQEGELLHIDPICPHRKGVSTSSLKVVSWLDASCSDSPCKQDREMVGKWRAICGGAYGSSNLLPQQPNGDDCGVYVCLYAVHAAISTIVDGAGVNDLCPKRRPQSFRQAIRVELLRRHWDVPRTQRQRIEDATPGRKQDG